LLASAGLYFYKGILNKNISQMKTDLELAKSRFEPSKISELQLLDRRLHAANAVFSNHISVTPIFQALESITMKTVRYTDFTYSFDAMDKGKLNIMLKGTAVGYRSVALQSDLFTANKNLIDPVFSNLTLDDKGNVNFDLQFSVDSSFVNYKQTLKTESQL
jgi:hypothetical protein